MARVALLVDEDFEDDDVRVVRERLLAGGHEAVIVATERGRHLSGRRGRETATAIFGSGDVSERDFDALFVPGGLSPDRLRTHLPSVRFARGFFTADKPIAAIGHGVALLVELEAVDDRTVTSWPSIKTDLINAGARWVDRPVVEDGALVTARRPEDLTAFCDVLLRKLDASTARSAARASEGAASHPPYH